MSSFGMDQKNDIPSQQQPRFTAPKPGTVRFIAVDVETAGYESASICQIGLAFVQFDGSIDTYSTYIDPRSPFGDGNTRLHGIDASTVFGAPDFADILPQLRQTMETHPLVQHSRFDEKAFDAACNLSGQPVLKSVWFDSVKIARRAWPEFKGNGGHGLGHLKTALGLEFQHHDAGEDARAAAEVVLKAETVMGAKINMVGSTRQLKFDFSL
jgi:DNA polymerase-3 subunit epsilon